MAGPVSTNALPVVAVVGAGTMGAGIAQTCLLAGHAVRLTDVSADAVARAVTRIGGGLGRALQRGRLTPHARAAALGRLHAGTDLAAAVGGSDVVIEAAVEVLAVKRDLFGALDGLADPTTLLATNTSALSIDAIADATAHPERVLGLHFFNPAPAMALVEVVAGERTDAATMQAGLAFVTGLGKTPVACGDAPGFVVNRINRPFTLEALRMLDAGEANVATIDAALVEAGYPMGPFTLMDLVGIDVNLAVARAIWHAFDEAPRFEPSPTQAALVEAGTLGRKTGRGFYAYGPDGRPIGLADLPGASAGGAGGAGAGAGRPADPPSAEVIVARLELAIINEAYDAAGEGVADPPDIDVALRLGAGHPYGPFERARALGLGTVVRGLARLEASYGERFHVAPALWQIASV